MTDVIDVTEVPDIDVVLVSDADYYRMLSLSQKTQILEHDLADKGREMYELKRKVDEAKSDYERMMDAFVKNLSENGKYILEENFTLSETERSVKRTLVKG